MSDEDERVEEDRRKILVKSLPFMINAAWEARSALSPVNLATTAVKEYQKIEKNHWLQEREIESFAKEIDHLKLKSEGGGRLSLTLDRKQILELVGNYLVNQFLTEGSWGARFLVTESYSGYDGVLSLANKNVFAKLVEEKIDDRWVFSEADRAEKLNPSEVWIFVLEEGPRSDIKFGPVFVSEHKIMRGRFRVLSISDVLRSTTKDRFTATKVAAPKSTEGVTFLLARRDQVR